MHETLHGVPLETWRRRKVQEDGDLPDVRAREERLSDVCSGFGLPGAGSGEGPCAWTGGATLAEE